MSRRTVFVDRDGVINRRRPDHVKSWSEFEFLPSALEALCGLNRSGVRTVVITNQSVVGRGLVSAAQLGEIHALMSDAIRRSGGEIAAIYVCPHAPELGCACRKPAPGLLMQAKAELALDLDSCVMVGDGECDIEAAAAAGCRAILVGDGAAMSLRRDVLVVPHLGEAVRQIELRDTELVRPC